MNVRRCARALPTDSAIAHGIKSTAGVVTAAALVMVGVFSIFATLSFIDMKQFGVGLAAAVLIDATLVRGVLLPASMKLLGDWNWYLPRRLGWIPEVPSEIEPERWSVVRDSQRPRLVGRFGRSLPKIPRGGHAEIRFTAGFGEAWEDVPADLRQAVFLLAAHFYENRAEGAVAGTMPFGVLVLIEAYRVTRLGGPS